jgi:endonuclease/exonuclease/phosphatase family metal-dependent hydrolase
MKRTHIAILISLASASVASAQWNPSARQYGKTDVRDLRVMTWNVYDTICSTSTTKVEGLNDWCAAARIIASVKPDVLILQEAGDNSGNGTGTGVDTVADLTTTIQLFLQGGNDPFRGNVAVTAYVSKYATTYNLPYIYVSDQSDGYNRNVILSRYPFVDLNGDNRVATGNFFNLADLYATGGGGGIRGFAFAEIDLPDAQYGGDLVMGCAHLKSGGTASDLADRLKAAQNVAYYIDYLFNGGGTAVPDPRNKIIIAPKPNRILDAGTPVIIGGDWNEDENTNGRDGPAFWLARAAGGVDDGTDRDRSDSTFDDARDIFNTNTRTTQGSSKLDYIAWQDSIATLRRAVIFNTATMNSNTYPAEIQGLAAPSTASGLASDHRPVIADFILPLPVAPSTFTLLSPGNGDLAQPLTPTLAWSAASRAGSYTVRVSLSPTLGSPIFTSTLSGTSLSIPAGVLNECQTYFWGVTATNSGGSTASTPSSFTFDTFRPADFNADGTIDFFDYLDFVAAFSNDDPAADFNVDGSIDFFDYLDFVAAFSQGC